MFHIIKGTFHVKGFQPDGDSIRFKAANSERWNALNLSVRTIINARDNVPGFIAAVEIDGFNRPVCLAFPADAPLVDGTALTAVQLPIELSANYQMCLEGLVYPTFYTSTDLEIVRMFGEATSAARDARRGFWVIDRTNGFQFWDVRTIYEDILIMPKIFRRLTSFCERYGEISELTGYLKKDKDPVRLLDGSRTTLDQLITVTGRVIELSRLPEEMLFVAK